MKRLFALCIGVGYLAPMLVMAQAVPVVTLSTPQGGQPPSATITPNSRVPAVAIALTSGSAPTTINGLVLRRVGSAADAAIVRVEVVDTNNVTLGSASGFSATNATVPLSIIIPAGERRTLVVFVTVAASLTPYQGQALNINIVGVNTSAVVNGPLPVFGSQLTLTSGVARPTCQISANPSTYGVGQTVTIDWLSTNATGGTITGLGTVGPSGRQGILPSGSGTYTGTFTGPGGTGTCSVPVVFNPSITGGVGNPGGVGAGGTVTSPGTIGGTGGIPGVGGATTVTPGTAGNSGTGSTGTGVSQVCTGLDCQICSFASLGQKVINFVIGLSIPLAAVMFAWAGIMYFTSAASPTNLERAKAAFRVALLGFLIAIASWLIIQTILKVVMNPQQYQNWNTIQCTGTARFGTPGNYSTVDQLFQAMGALNTRTPTAGIPGAGIGIGTESIYNPSTGTYSAGYSVGSGNICGNCGSGFSCQESATEYWCQRNGTTFNENEDDNWREAPGGGVTGGSRGYAQCISGNLNCDVNTLSSLGLTQAQANAMSCIAVTESSGMSNLCSGTGPCGTFQITRTNWGQFAPSGCRAADFGGNIVAAQNDPTCNQQTMAIMVQSNPSNPYQPWTGHNNGVYWNPAARTCVNNYDSSYLR